MIGSWKLRCNFPTTENNDAKKTNSDAIGIWESTKRGSTVPLIIVFNPTVFTVNLRPVAVGDRL